MYDNVLNMLDCGNCSSYDAMLVQNNYILRLGLL